MASMLWGADRPVLEPIPRTQTFLKDNFTCLIASQPWILPTIGDAGVAKYAPDQHRKCPLDPDVVR